MADITMCKGQDCVRKNTCYRFTAFPNEYRQAYFVGIPYKGEGCEHYWKMEEHDYADHSRHRNNDESQEDSRSGN